MKTRLKKSLGVFIVVNIFALIGDAFIWNRVPVAAREDFWVLHLVSIAGIMCMGIGFFLVFCLWFVIEWCFTD
jgi:hypothetical protein